MIPPRGSFLPLVKLMLLSQSHQKHLELRGRDIGHVIMNSSVDRPWSQYFCCMLTGNRDFVLKHPVVTKLWLKAVLKGTDLCASEPRRVANLMVERELRSAMTTRCRH